jgi:DNA-binding MarR family transcriptional regulator
MTAADLMFSLLDAADILRSRLEQGLAGEGLSLAKYSLLRILVDAGKPLPLSEIANRQSCVRSNVTQLMDRLEADGLVRRVADPDDRRSIRAAITSEGEQREAAGRARIAEIQAAFTATLAPTDRPALERMLSAMR